MLVERFPADNGVSISSMTPTFPIASQASPFNPSKEVNSAQKIALGILLLDLVIYFSRFLDEFHGGFHLPGVVFVLMVVTTLISGRVLKGLESRATLMLIAFVFWNMVASIFSIWRSYSVPVFETLLFSVAFYVAVAGLPSTLRHVHQILTALAISFLISAGLSSVFGTTRGGRMQLEIGNYHDPNQYAMCLLMGMPLWWYLASTAKNSFARAFCFLCTIPMFLIFIQTGSRGGLLGLFTILGFEFLFASVNKKVVLLVLAGLAAIVAFAVMPGYIKTRYLTFFDSSAVDLQNQSDDVAFLLRADMDSAAGRKALLFKSVDITLHHPIAGVGPGNFPTEVFTLAQQSGENYAWFATHNSYTQISSETGIPGLLLFVSMILYGFRNLRIVLRQTGPRGTTPWPEMWSAAKYLRLSLMATSVCMFFLSSGYTCEMYVLVAVTISLERAMRNGAPEAVAVVSGPPSISAGFRQQKTQAPIPAPVQKLKGPRWVGPRPQ